MIHADVSRPTYHDVELLRVRHELHATVIDDDFVVVDDGVLLGHGAAGLEEQTVRKFHDVRLVDSCHRLAVVEIRVLKGVPGDTLGAKLCDHLGGVGKRSGFLAAWRNYSAKRFEPGDMKAVP